MYSASQIMPINSKQYGKISTPLGESCVGYAERRVTSPGAALKQISERLKRIRSTVDTPETSDETIAGLFSSKRIYPDANAFIVFLETLKNDEIKNFLRFITPRLPMLLYSFNSYISLRNLYQEKSNHPTLAKQIKLDDMAIYSRCFYRNSNNSIVYLHRVFSNHKLRRL